MKVDLKSALLLDRLTYWENGNLRSAYVVNGHWNIKGYRDGRIFVKEKTNSPLGKFEDMELVDAIGGATWGEYNEILQATLKEHGRKEWL